MRERVGRIERVSPSPCYPRTVAGEWEDGKSRSSFPPFAPRWLVLGLGTVCRQPAPSCCRTSFAAHTSSTGPGSHSSERMQCGCISTKQPSSTSALTPEARTAQGGEGGGERKGGKAHG